MSIKTRSRKQQCTRKLKGNLSISKLKYSSILKTSVSAIKIPSRNAPWHVLFLNGALTNQYRKIRLRVSSTQFLPIKITDFFKPFWV